MKDSAEKNVSSQALREAWAGYHSAIEEFRQRIEASHLFRDFPKQRAKAYHQLLELQAMAYNFAIAPRMAYPRILWSTSWHSYNYSMLQNSPDFLYNNLFVDGRHSFRISGRVGDTSMFAMQVGEFVAENKNIALSSGGHDMMKLLGNCDLKDLAKEDGTFEIILSARKQDGNWMALNADTVDHFIYFRRALQDWHADPGEIHIERIGELPEGYYEAEEFDEAFLARRIVNAERFMRWIMALFLSLYDLFYKAANNQTNVMNLQGGDEMGEGVSPYALYGLACYEFDDDEALIIELDPVPDGVYWSFSLTDVWSRGMNFIDRHSSLNDQQAEIGANGKFVAVMSNRDPGIKNWLDTCGFNDGTIVFRSYRSTNKPLPVIKRVKLAELDALLPKDATRVTPEERKTIIAHRRLGIEKRYGE